MTKISWILAIITLLSSADLLVDITANLPVEDLFLKTVVVQTIVALLSFAAFVITLGGV